MPWGDFITVVAQLVITLATMLVFAFVVSAVFVGIRDSIRGRKDGEH